MPTQADLDALNEALATGERVVRKGDKQIEYRSVAELIAARDELARQMANEQAASSGLRPPRQYRAAFGGRGY